jgi:uncharacterized protein YcfJ
MNTSLKLKSAMAVALLSAGGTALASPAVRAGGLDYARVVDVTPIVQRVRVTTPAQECWTDTEFQTIRHETRSFGPGQSAPVNSVAPTLAGGLIGGVIGRQFGSGSGKDAMTAVGALVGASVGNRAAYAQAAPPTQVTFEERPVSVERCRNVTSERVEERIEGYRVTYLYADREYVTTMAQHPGTSIPVRVSVVPSGGQF